MENRYIGRIIGRVAGHIFSNLYNAICPSAINEATEKDQLNGKIAFDNVNWQSQIVNNRVVGCNLFPSDRKIVKLTARFIPFSFTR